MTTWAPYQGAFPPCSSGPQPGTINLMRALLDIFPDAYNLGIFNCREVGGGGSWSLHSDGRAFDCGLPLVDGHANPIGLDVVARIKPVAGELGVMEAIFSRVRWSDDYPNGTYYGGEDPHISHVHLGQTWYQAAHLTYERARGLLAGYDPSDPGGEVIDPEEDVDDNMPRYIKITGEPADPKTYGYSDSAWWEATDEEVTAFRQTPMVVNARQRDVIRSRVQQNQKDGQVEILTELPAKILFQIPDSPNPDRQYTFQGTGYRIWVGAGLKTALGLDGVTIMQLPSDHPFARVPEPPA